MSSSTSMQLDAGRTPPTLTIFTVQEWKRYIINEPQKINAYTILVGKERAPPEGSSVANIKLTSSYNEQASKIALLEAYKPKTATNHITVLQELVSLRKGSDGHESKTYQKYGSRALNLANRLVSLLSGGPIYIKEQISDIELGKDNTKRTVRNIKTDEDGTYQDSVFSPGYSARDLAIDLALSMIPIGLNKEDEMLRHTINHLDTNAEPKDILEHLNKADSLACAQSAAGASISASVLNAKQKKEKKPYKCSVHGPNMSHNDDRYKVLLGKKQPKDTPKAAQASSSKETLSEVTPTEQVMIAQVAHIASPPRRRIPFSKANTYWNTDSGATSHMTPHCRWIC
ncbi:hypothetical protein MD484_g9014, partial [Candolleomyces efflorescens]